MQNDKFEFVIPFAFPINEIQTNVEYADTEKPSGVSYLILTLINEFAGNDLSMANVMAAIGVPEDLYHIFVREVLELISNGIIRINDDVDNEVSLDTFADLRINDFAMTEMGKDIFQSEILPSKKRMSMHSTIYHDPVTQTLSKNPPAAFIIETPGAQVPFDNPNQLEAWLNTNKMQFDIKKDQRILSIAITEKTVKAINRNSKVILDVNMHQCDIRFDNNEINQFFAKYLEQDYVTSVLLNSRPDWPVIGRTEVQYANRIMHPSGIDEMLRKKYRIFFASKITGKSVETHIPLKVDDYFFVGVDRQAIGYHRVLFPAMVSDKNWPVNIPCIVETPINFSELEPIAIRHLITMNIADSISDIVNVIDVFQSSTIIDQLIVNRLSADKEGLRLLELLSAKGRNVRILTEAIRKISTLWLNSWVESLFKRWDEDLVRTILRARGLSDYKEDQIIDLLVKPSPDIIASRLALLEWMTSGGLRESAVLARMNLVPELVKAVYTTNEKKNDKQDVLAGAFQISVKFRSLRDAFRNLNALLKLEDPNQYVSKETIASAEFKRAYDAFKKAKKELDNYQILDPSGFSQFKNYVAIYEIIADIIANEEKIIATNPDRLTKSYITELIQDRQDLKALVSIACKAESIFKKAYSKVSTLEDMIDLALESKIVSQKEQQDLHRFRKERNRTVHYDPSNKSIDYDKSDLLRWMDLWFRIEADIKAKASEEKRK
jgi:hypothetical protein